MASHGLSAKRTVGRLLRLNLLIFLSKWAFLKNINKTIC
jgi:hypothetical protein